MSNTVKIVRFHQTGPAEVLQFDELPLPEPGPGEIRLRVKALGLNRAEVMFRSGQYLETPVHPAKNGYEASGIIEAVGSGVDSSWIGKTASTVPGTFKLNDHGVYGEVAVVPVHGIAEYPLTLSYEQGASIWMQYLTAYGALVWIGHVAKNDFVVITAASSSVGVAAIEIVKAEGAVSIAVTRTAAKKAQLLRLGADHVIVTDEEDLVTRVNEITSGKGARIVFDPIGGKILEALAAATASKGIIFEYGALAPEPTPYPLFTALAKYLTIRAYTLFELTPAPEFSKAKQYIFDHLASGAFKPLIDKTFRFAEIVEAHRYMESNAQVGKIVVTL
ncbi:NADPH:quinone reductase-like Zn-dependent oxidoreductase [Silvibacterium bohemicum]|uniref:NADPH:quinone reductase-like Zn-dependent oxidoreductase n=1 Tax=Silvibacterium bohemicum TaxID=1577686 RepID=A0A841JYV1_9BACT|nr:zinc-dependent alcohol dehydrogenase family protein [Silvibacterium bohemicum]MBB6144141.1 NADPH:quinone reductase-like Zn-dependent oxidoreductase [Silvibacterium bohemicum]